MFVCLHIAGAATAVVAIMRESVGVFEVICAGWWEAPGIERVREIIPVDLHNGVKARRSLLMTLTPSCMRSSSPSLPPPSIPSLLLAFFTPPYLFLRVRICMFTGPQQYA